MLLNTSDNSVETVHFQRRGIDRTLGYLVVGVAVLSFFLLSVFGMRQVQDMSDHAVGTKLATPEPKSAEISESIVAEPPRSE